MARYNEILVGRFNRALQKLFSMKGDAPAPQLSSDIQSQVQFFQGVESRAYEAWSRYRHRIFVANVAAQVGVIRFRNPSGSGVVAVMETIRWNNSGAAADNIVVYRDTALGDLGAPLFTTDQSRDDPRAGTQTPTIHLTTGNVAPPAASGVTLSVILGAVNFTVEMISYDNQELCVLPGDTLGFANTTVNQGFDVSLGWRERALESSEQVGGASLGSVL